MKAFYRVIFSVSILGLPTLATAAVSPMAKPSKTVFESVTGETGDGERTRWDAIYSTTSYVYGREPAEFLKKHIHLLPVGKALDIAMGEGRNAVFLARKGFRVLGVDISDVALRKARRLAKEARVTIETQNADLNHYRIRPGEWDVILNINYLQRSLIPEIKRGLKPGGVVVFENWTTDQMKNAKGQSLLREYLLEPGELRQAFSDFDVLLYEETNDGREARASLIARKPGKP